MCPLCKAHDKERHLKLYETNWSYIIYYQSCEIYYLSSYGRMREVVIKGEAKLYNIIDKLTKKHLLLKYELLVLSSDFF
jgi:hypothetical protein